MLAYSYYSQTLISVQVKQAFRQTYLYLTVYAIDFSYKIIIDRYQYIRSLRCPHPEKHILRSVVNICDCPYRLVFVINVDDSKTFKFFKRKFVLAAV